MSDERLRNLERRAVGGDVDAQGLVLRTRLRLGTVALEGLRLAAHLGDPAASAALGEPPTPPFQSLEDLLRRGAIFGREPWTRAALAAANIAAEAWDAPSPSLQRQADRLLAATAEWLACPCAAHAEAIGPLAKRAPERFLRDTALAILEQSDPGARRVARQAIRGAAEVAGEAPVRQRLTEALTAWATSSSCAAPGRP